MELGLQEHICFAQLYMYTYIHTYIHTYIQTRQRGDSFWIHSQGLTFPMDSMQTFFWVLEELLEQQASEQVSKMEAKPLLLKGQS